MEKPPDDKPSGRSVAIAAALAISAGAGTGWALILATGSAALGIGMAGSISYLMNNFLRKVIK